MREELTGGDLLKNKIVETFCGELCKFGKFVFSTFSKLRDVLSTILNCCLQRGRVLAPEAMPFVIVFLRVNINNQIHAPSIKIIVHFFSKPFHKRLLLKSTKLLAFKTYFASIESGTKVICSSFVEVYVGVLCT